MLTNNKNINILRKACPHLDERSKTPINIILKLCELSESINNLSNYSGLESCENNTPIDAESLLKDIRSECSKQEQDMIDFILNLTKTRDFYNTYKNISNIDTSSLTNNIDALKNKLSPEQLNRINELSKLINNH